MERTQLPSSRHFFKALIGGFRQKLDLPRCVCEEMKRVKSRKVTVQSRKGKWKISLCRDNDVISFFGEEWVEFVRSHELSDSEILVFERTSELHFNVSVFDKSWCEKEFEVVKPKEERQDDDDDDDDVVAEEERETPHPQFVKTMMPSHAGRTGALNIPWKFLRSNDLGQQRTANLRDPSGRIWPVILSGDNRKEFWWKMVGGWRDFYAANALKDGDICVFRLRQRLLTQTTATIFFDVHILSTQCTNN